MNEREFDDTKDGKSELDTLSYDIFIYAETLAEVNDLGLKVRNALDRYSGTNSGLVIQSVHFTSEDVGYSDKDRVYLKGQNYSFRYETIYSTLSAVTNLSISASSTTQLDLTWTDNASGESGYEVWRSSTANGGYTLITTTAANATSYSDTGLTVETVYYYRVRPTDGTYGGEWSNIVAGRTDNTDGATPSGIAYFRPQLTGQTTSYRTGDDAWNLANNVYDYTEPTYPSSYAKLDNDAVSPFTTLLNNNAFGNKNRFTDDVGGQTYSNNYVIDHLTGLGWYIVASTGVDWNTFIDNAQSSTQNSFSDWRVPNKRELSSIADNELTEVLNYSPFSFNSGFLFASTTLTSSTTTAYRISTGGVVGAQTKTVTNHYSFIVRNHYT